MKSFEPKYDFYEKGIFSVGINLRKIINKTLNTIGLFFWMFLLLLIPPLAFSQPVEEPIPKQIFKFRIAAIVNTVTCRPGPNFIFCTEKKELPGKIALALKQKLEESNNDQNFDLDLERFDAPESGLPIEIGNNSYKIFRNEADIFINIGLAEINPSYREASGGLGVSRSGRASVQTGDIYIIPIKVRDKNGILFRDDFGFMKTNGENLTPKNIINPQDKIFLGIKLLKPEMFNRKTVFLGCFSLKHDRGDLESLKLDPDAIKGLEKIEEEFPKTILKIKADSKIQDFFNNLALRENIETIELKTIELSEVNSACLESQGDKEKTERKFYHYSIYGEITPSRNEEGEFSYPPGILEIYLLINKDYNAEGEKITFEGNIETKHADFLFEDTLEETLKIIIKTITEKWPQEANGDG